MTHPMEVGGQYLVQLFEKICMSESPVWLREKGRLDEAHQFNQHPTSEKES
jgi:hypothetical protein